MLSVSPPLRDALLSPLPRGLSPWGTLISPNSLYSIPATHQRLDRPDHSHNSSVSSRAETPILVPRWRTGRNGSGVGHANIIESWGSSGGVILENPGKISPAVSPRTRDSYPHSNFDLDSRVGSPRSPLSRKKGSVSLIRMQRSEEEVPMRIKSQKSLEKADPQSGRGSLYIPPTVENIDDAFFTGAATPEPPSQRSRGELVKSPSKEIRYIRGPPPLTEQEKSRCPSTVVEDIPDCYTPTPQTKGPRVKSILDPQDDDLDGTTAASKSAHGKEELTKSNASASTLLRLKYPSSHHATIEIQHREGIRITTSGRGSSGNGGSKISIQVDMDSKNGGSYTSTIRTGGKRGAMSVTVRPSSNKSKETAESAAEDVEDEVLVISSTARKSKSKSQRHSYKSEKHRSITPSRQQSMNLIDLMGSAGAHTDGAQDTSPEMCRTVRKVEKSNDLKRESATGSRIQSALLNGINGNGDFPGQWSILDRPVSLQKRTSGTSGYINNILLPTMPSNYSIGDMQMDMDEGGDWQCGDDQTVISQQEAACPESPTLRELPPGGRKPRPLSNSNVPVEVALTMGFRGVSGAQPSSVVTMEEPPIPGMVPVLPNNGIGIMGMEGMAGGWI